MDGTAEAIIEGVVRVPSICLRIRHRTLPLRITRARLFHPDCFEVIQLTTILGIHAVNRRPDPCRGAHEERRREKRAMHH